MAGLLDDVLAGSSSSGLLGQMPRIQPPPEAGPNTDLASAASSTYGNVADWIANQRQQSVNMGLLDPNTGWPTPEGWKNAARSYAGAMVIGNTSPEIEGAKWLSNTADQIAKYAPDYDPGEVSGEMRLPRLAVRSAVASQLNPATR